MAFASKSKISPAIETKGGGTPKGPPSSSKDLKLAILVESWSFASETCHPEVYESGLRSSVVDTCHDELGARNI
jgi:hypothetical protein